MLEALQAARRHGLRVQLSMFAEGRAELSDVGRALAATDYVIALYGPLVDILEVANEARPQLLVMDAVARRVRERAPHLLLTTSWNDAAYAPWVGINSPHFCGEEHPFESRQVITDLVAREGA